MTEEERNKKQQRFNKYVSPSGECLIWNGCRFSNGYGAFKISDRTITAHRASYMLAHNLDSFPSSFVLCHKCDNPLCVRPEHLSLGTQGENLRNMVSKGRHWNTQKTHCRYGHPYEGENLVIQKNGRRSCRRCARIICINIKLKRRGKKPLHRPLPQIGHRHLNHVRGFSDGAGSKEISPAYENDMDYTSGYYAGQKAKRDFTLSSSKKYKVKISETIPLPPLTSITDCAKVNG